MATINLVLDTRRVKKDETYPLVFRLRLGDKFSDISTGFSIPLKQWDKKTSSIVKDQVSNDQLEELRAHYLKRLRSYLVANVGKETIKDIKIYLTNKQHEELTILEFWNQHIESLRTAGRDGGARVYENSLSGLGSEIDFNVPFSKIAYSDLMKLEECLYKRGMSANGISVYMRTFRAICNKAIDLDVVSSEWYPFRKYKLKKDKTTPRVITIAEMRAYFNLNLSADHHNYRSWQLGKLIFLLRGINLKDLLLLSSSNIKGDRVIYKRSKTGKIYSVKITPEVWQILSQFSSGETLLGILTKADMKDGQQFVKTYTQKRGIINKHLKKIGQMLNTQTEITTYVFRYSYANIAKQLGYSKDVIAEALGHEYGNSVTGIYLEQFDLEVVDEMNERIINSIVNVRVAA